MGIVLVINRRSDGDLVREAERLAGDGLAQPKAHPEAAVHARELSGEPTTLWCAYRDGRWTRDEGA